MKVAIGQKLVSSVDATAAVVVRCTGGDVNITCGGAPMVDAQGSPGSQRLTADPALMGGTQVGKRYVDDGAGLELLCVSGGEGSLAIGATPMTLKASRQLPSSD